MMFLLSSDGWARIDEGRIALNAEQRTRSGRLVGCCSLGEEGVAVHLERAGVRFAGGVGERVDRRPDGDVFEPGVFEHPLPARTGQPSGDSTGPQIDIAYRLDRDGTAVGDVGELQRAAGAQDAEDFGEDGLLVGAQVDDTVGDDDVGPSVIDGHGLCEPLAELDVIEPEMCGRVARFGQHLGCHVDADDASGGSDVCRGDEGVEPRARADVDDLGAGFDALQGERVADPGKRLHGAVGEVVDDGVVVAEPVRERATGVEVVWAVWIDRDIAVLLTHLCAQRVHIDKQFVRHDWPSIPAGDAPQIDPCPYKYTSKIAMATEFHSNDSTWTEAIRVVSCDQSIVGGFSGLLLAPLAGR